MLQLLILVGRALALGLRGHRELVLENLTLRQQLIAMKRANNRPRLQARVRNHAHAIVACDFFTTVRVGFRVLYVFVVLEVGTRRIVHWRCRRGCHRRTRSASD